MIASLRDSCIFDAICLVPGNAFQYVRLWASGDFIRTSIVLDLKRNECTLTSEVFQQIFLFTNLLLHSLKLLRGGSGWHKLQWILNSHGRWVSGRTFSNPLIVFESIFNWGTSFRYRIFRGHSTSCVEFGQFKKKERERNLFYLGLIVFLKYVRKSLNLNNANISAICTLIS